MIVVVYRKLWAKLKLFRSKSKKEKVDVIPHPTYPTAFTALPCTELFESILEPGYKHRAKYPRLNSWFIKLVRLA